MPTSASSPLASSSLSPGPFRLAAVALALAVSAVFILSGSDAAAAGKRVAAQGRVLTASGEGMPGWPVVLIGTQRYIELKRFSSGGGVAILTRATTDASGYFSIDVPKDRHYQFWFLRFAEQGGLDPVKYRTPEDVEITADVRRDRVATVQKTIQLNPAWPEVERRVAEAGGESSEKGKILRALGLPEKSVKDDVAGTEEWWYFTKGILYTFSGTQPVSERHFAPVAPPPGGGAS